MCRVNPVSFCIQLGLPLTCSASLVTVEVGPTAPGIIVLVIDEPDCCHGVDKQSCCPLAKAVNVLFRWPTI
jgi:hypothetical protein